MSDEFQTPSAAADALPGQVDASRSDGELPFTTDDLKSMNLDQLREIRRVLTDRESQISYWRRIIQARLDLLRDGALKRGATIEGLQRILSQQMGANNRKGMLSLKPEKEQPIPGLNHLWHRGLNGDDDEQLEADLIAAERQLSAARSQLFGLIDGATEELIHRYQADPSLALTALPHRQQRPSPL